MRDRAGTRDGGYLLVTGFEPFGGGDLNPSALIAERLDGETMADIRIKGVCLPVDLARLPGLLDGLLDGPAPTAVINFGLANGRTAVAVERVAVNSLDFNIPDNAGELVRDHAIVPGGPDAYLSRLPLRVSVDGLKAEGIPAYISNTAGSYLCNACMYLVLHKLQERGWRTPAGFVHVPYLPEQAARQEEPKPSLPLEMLIRAACRLLEAAIRQR